MYGGLNRGRVDFARLRRMLAGLPLPLPRAADGRLVLAADVSPWRRPDANNSPDRSFCHTYGRGKNEHRMLPGWPHLIVAALEVGRTSWTALLDAIRLEPGADVAEDELVAVLGRPSALRVVDPRRRSADASPGPTIAAVTAVRVREIVERLVAARQWKPGGLDICGDSC